MTRSIKLVGLDCGSTTTSAVVARARLTTGALGRVEITDLEPLFRSEMVFTPFVHDRIDAVRLARYFDDWLAAAQVAPQEIFGGGALITGLAAQTANAGEVARLIEARMADSVVATADDPCLESWLAFMGNCHALSKTHPRTPILNLDIGGGTTNLAWGLDGQVIATGCFFVGARHFQFVPGTYQMTQLSPHAAALLEHLHFDRRVGDVLEPTEVNAILDFYVELIESAVEGNKEPLATTIGKRHVQVPPQSPGAIDSRFAVTLSGGVGQLVYAQLRGEPPGGVTRFGDLGGELASRLVRSPSVAGRMGELAPEGLGRATVYGLLRHGTELSGSTLYLPRPERLPLKNVPIVGRIGPDTADDELARLLDLAARSLPAGCIQIELGGNDVAALRNLAARISGGLQARAFPPGVPLVLLVQANLGKVLGNYITRWGTLKVELIVIDEVASRDAQFVRLGRLSEGTVPLALYGIR
jgi:ethanolamine utilization protein EutA